MQSKRDRAEYQRAYREKNKERLRKYRAGHRTNNPAKAKAYRKKWLDRNPLRAKASMLIRAARQRAKKAGLPMELDLEWAVERMVRCELSGLPFNEDPGRHPRSRSIDRIDSSKGYTKDNSRMICWALNAAFCDWGMEEFKRIWENVKDGNERKPV